MEATKDAGSAPLERQVRPAVPKRAKRLTAAQKRMTAMVASMQAYMATYHEQQNYRDYSDKTFIDDVLYGLGLALDSEAHCYASGFRVFAAKLKAHLEQQA